MSAVRGLLLILNVARDRSGTEFDAQNLEKTFKDMGADVSTVENPGGNDIIAIMCEFKRRDFTNYSYVAVAYLSHGFEDGYAAAEGDIIKLQKSILVPLCRIPSLDGKLKWLITQTCRGNYDFIKEKSEGTQPLVLHPRFCLKCFATAEGTRAYRQPDGSLFIKAICERLRNEFKTYDIISIMNNASGDVVEKCRASVSTRLIQTPCLEDNFGDKVFYFTSGFIDK